MRLIEVEQVLELLVERDAQDERQLRGGVEQARFDGGDGLARHEDRLRDLVLGKPALLSLGLQLPSQFRRSLPFDCPLARRVACAHRNDTPQALQNEADATVKSLSQGF